MPADPVVPRARQIVLAIKGSQKVPWTLPGSEMPRPGFLFTEAQGCWVQKTDEGRTCLLPCPFLRAQASQASLGFGELVPKTSKGSRFTWLSQPGVWSCAKQPANPTDGRAGSPSITALSGQLPSWCPRQTAPPSHLPSVPPYPTPA